VSSRKGTILDLHIDRYLKHFRALGRGYCNEERTVRSLTTFLVKRKESDLRADLFDAWCRTFATLSANTRRLLLVRAGIHDAQGRIPRVHDFRHNAESRIIPSAPTGRMESGGIPR
jgi:hypothetical protein